MLTTAPVSSKHCRKHVLSLLIPTLAPQPSVVGIHLLLNPLYLESWKNTHYIMHFYLICGASNNGQKACVSVKRRKINYF